jgi:hypothetical protein
LKRPVEYPELEQITRTYQPQRLLGAELVWEEKEDGSNLMVWLDKDTDIFKISSRHMEDADREFQNRFKNTPQAALVESLIRDELKDYGKDLVVFGELLSKGKSPTRITVHPETTFVTFDIYDVAAEKWNNYTAKYQKCFHYNLPVAKAMATCKVASMEELLAFRDKVLEMVKVIGRIEGTVVKTQYLQPTVFAKEKLDTPKLEKLPRAESDGVQLPPLPESEILGALDKAYVDLGIDKFMDKSVAMPLFARYVSEEAKKHLCKVTVSLFKFYQQKTEDLASENK